MDYFDNNEDGKAGTQSKGFPIFRPKFIALRRLDKNKSGGPFLLRGLDGHPHPRDGSHELGHWRADL